jgi:histidine racemase
MIIQKFLIAGGNSTALVAHCPDSQRAAAVKTLLDQVEQVGFVDHDGRLSRIQMMGGEFCINATIAFASTLGTSGSLTSSGAVHPVSFINTNKETTIRLPIAWRKQGNMVLLEGIGFILLENHSREQIGKKKLSALCRKFDLPAFGAILFQNDAITPYVYVAGVDSCVRETACGSGSVALYLHNGTSRVRQPTGQFITVSGEQEIHISARVTAMEGMTTCPTQQDKFVHGKISL